LAAIRPLHIQSTVATQKGQNASPSAVQENYSRTPSRDFQVGNCQMT
jgi:hypothetical protein